MSNKSLRNQSVSGVVWSSVQKFGVLIITFVANMILARLLSPDDFGCIGMLAIFIGICDIFIDGGFAEALIQKKRPTQEDYSTIFYCNLSIAIVLYVVLFFSAPAIARFYNIPLLKNVLRVQGVILIINGFRIIQANQIRKNLKFKELSIIDLISAILALGTTIILAYNGWGVWALVAQQLCRSFITVFLMWFVNKWYPSLIFSIQSFKELFSFGGFVLLGNLVSTICGEIQGLLIGKFFNPATMGYYSQARKLESIPTSGLTAVINQVAYPVLSEAQHDNRSLILMIRRFIVSMAFLVFPLMLILILIGKPLIVACYSEKWLPAVPYFKILCLAGIPACLNGINYYAVAVKGRSKELFYGTLIKRGIGLCFVVGGLVLGGIKGILFGTVISTYISYIVNAIQVKRHVGYGLLSQIKDVLPVLICSAVTFCVVFLTTYYLRLNMFLEGGIRLVFYGLLYFGASYIFKLEAFAYFIGIIKELKAKKNG